RSSLTLIFARWRQADILRVMASDRSSDLNRATIGVGQLLMGFTMACVGGYLVSNQVIVAGSYWSFYGTNTFGITLVPMLIGIGMLFWSGRSTLGWLLTAGGALFILAGV